MYYNKSPQFYKKLYNFGGSDLNSHNTQLALPGLKSKVAVVTGGGSGIGKTISLTLAALGIKIVIIDISEKTGRETSKEIIDKGGSSIFLKGDVTDEINIRGCMKAAVEKMGGIDILVNNAGIAKTIPLDELDLKEWKKVIEVNLTGPFICSKEAMGYILKRGGGTIIMVSSGSAITGSGGGAHYASSKGGINSLTRALSRELAPRGIRVNGVAPRAIESEQLDGLYPKEELDRIKGEIPLKRLGTRQDVANAIAYLASDLSAFTTGEVLLLDGGRTFNR